MISLIDSTVKQSKDISFDSLLSLLKDTSIDGVNWWNSTEFPHYLRQTHINPWLLLDNIFRELKGKKFIIDLRVNQLSNFKPFSTENVHRYLTNLPENKNIFIKIFDPLNDLKNIQNMINIVLKNNLNLIGSIFLRPDCKDFPSCHENLIKLYADNDIKNINILEPLGLLKQNNIIQIKKLIDKTIKNAEISLSFKHFELQQPILLSEAIVKGITEIEYSLIPEKFGFPSLKSIYEAFDCLNMNSSLKNFPLKLLNKFNNDYLSTLNNNNNNNRSIELLQVKSDFPKIPVNTIYAIRELKYFTNVPFELNTILSEITKTQLELGNPPLIEPFSAIIISQAIFRLQNSNKSLQTLDTMKYIAGYWGERKEDLSGDFKEFLPLADSLKKKSKIFKFSQLDSQEVTNLNKTKKDTLKDEKDKIILELFPEEANYFFNEYTQRPKSFDISKRSNLAILMKVYFEQNHQINGNDFPLNLQANYNQKNVNTNEFRWRYLSRLFQMGKF